MAFRHIKKMISRASFDLERKEVRQYILLIALLAWIGLGSDSLSYVTQAAHRSFFTFGHHTYLGFDLAIVVTMTIFITSWIYGQTIELFPKDGGGYKIAAKLANPFVGLITGVSLVLGYVLTIALAFAGGIDTLFSILPPGIQPYKLSAEVGLIGLLMYLNLKGMKEPIKIVIFIFWAFFLTHCFIIIYGISSRWDHWPTLWHQLTHQTQETINLLLVLFLLLLSLLFRAFAFSGSRRSQNESTSSHRHRPVEHLAIFTKPALFMMIILLGFMIVGILCLYTIGDVNAMPGVPLNVTLFDTLLTGIPYHKILLAILLILESSILFIAANTGFLGGPAVLASMAIDGWMPKRFRHLSNRLVTQNGVMLFGFSALAILIWTHGSVSLLMVLYCTSVFIAFTASMLGIGFYWFTQRKKSMGFLRLMLSAVGFFVCLDILLAILAVKFSEGSLTALLMIAGIAVLCLIIKHHYHTVKRQTRVLDKLFYFSLESENKKTIPLEPSRPTAVFLIGDSIGEGMHTMLTMRRMFVDHFKNYVFVSVGVIDVNCYGNEKNFIYLEKKITQRLNYFVNYANQLGVAAVHYYDFGTDPIEKIDELSNKVIKDFPASIFFAAKLILKNETWLTRLLHNETPLSVQRHLLLRGIRMVILPIQVNLKS